MVCKELGYPTGMATINSYNGPGYGPIVMDHVDCDGTESALWSCHVPSYVSSSCDHSKDAGVKCTGSSNGPSKYPSWNSHRELI